MILLFSKRVHCTWVGRNIDWTRDKLLQIIHLQCNNKFWEFKIHTKTQVECFLFIKTRLIFVDILLCRVQALFDSYLYHDILMPSNSQGCFLKEPLIGYSRKKNKGIWGHTFLKTPMNFYFIPGNSTLFSINSWKIHLLFLQYPWKFHTSPPLLPPPPSASAFFFWNSLMLTWRHILEKYSKEGFTFQ